MADQELTPMQKAFVDEYRSTGNGSQSAIRAGYSRGRSSESACRLLRNSKVLAAIGELISIKRIPTTYRKEDEKKMRKKCCSSQSIETDPEIFGELETAETHENAFAVHIPERPGYQGQPIAISSYDIFS